MKSLSNLSAGAINLQDIVEMESLILKSLQWNLCPPTASSFCYDFHFLLPAEIDAAVKKSLLENSYFHCELSLCQGNLRTLKPSEVAFAATLNAIGIFDESAFPMAVKQKFVHDIEMYCTTTHDIESIRFARREISSLKERSKQFMLQTEKQVEME